VLTSKDPTYSYTSAGGVPVDGSSIAPRALTEDEIREYIQDHAAAAKAAIFEAGFDGVEVAGSGGYLIDEFFKAATNTRTDKYGGSVENRARIFLEILDAVVAAVGADRVGLKISPWTLANRAGDLYSMLYFLKALRFTHQET
jgi:NADPH2 dehydrogenase